MNKNLIREYSRSLYLSLFGSISFPKPGIHIINSHYISPNNSDAKTMFRLLENMSAHCSFICFDEAVKMILLDRIPQNKALVAFSFDDGFEECYSIIAPILEQFGTNAAFFINSGFIDNTPEYWTQRRLMNDRLLTTDKKPMTWSQIRELHERGHIIGSHTADHVNLNTPDLAFAEAQISVCKNRIEEKVGNSCEYMAFPYGNLHHINEDTLKIAKNYHSYVFSGTNYKHYFSLNGSIINRRHIEPFWPYSHVKYFLSHKKSI